MTARNAPAEGAPPSADLTRAGEDAGERFRRATAATLRRLSEELALDVDTVELLKHMNSDQVSAEIDQTAELARALRISGTPSFVMESEMLRGYLPADQMAEIAAELRAK